MILVERPIKWFHDLTFVLVKLSFVYESLFFHVVKVIFIDNNSDS